MSSSKKKNVCTKNNLTIDDDNKQCKIEVIEREQEESKIPNLLTIEDRCAQLKVEN